MAFLVLALVVYVVAVSLVCAAAYLRGGPNERAAASALLIAAALTQVAALSGNHWRGPEYGVMLVDVAFFGVLVVIALKSTRYWPIWAAASQLVGTLTHLPAVFGPSIPMETYASTQPFWAFPILAAIAWGTWEQVTGSRYGPPRPTQGRREPAQGR